ncbi:MAG: LPS biosynthesis protein [Gammaproteobacteria bacterium]|nr:MAG: LPS biosynthesis protein [Gammaproteobacteria bacterium]
MHFHLKFFTLFILLLSVVSRQAFAEQSIAENLIDVNATCPITAYEKITLNQEITDKNAITIVSKYSNIDKNIIATFSGGVVMVSKEQRISAEQLEFNRLQESFNAQGNIHFQANNIDVFSQSISANKEHQATILKKSAYQLANNPAHGKAGELSISKQGDLTLKNSSFTTCQSAQPDWLLEASKIYISTRKNRGEAYNAKLKFFGVPVFYIPYFSFPVTDQRKSGFLYPKLGSSNRSGFKIETPYYWNIAPNIDATITPRYMSKRGLQLLTEFRYLSGLQSGSVNLEYLNKDLNVNNSDARYLARIQHIGTFSNNYRLYTDYTTISDDNYLVDLESEHYSSNDAYLYQIGELSYFSENWRATIKLQDFEVLGNHVQSYRTVPQIEFSSFNPLTLLNTNFELYSELSRFETPDKSQPSANRFHVEAGFTLPIMHPGWFLNSELKLLQTYYQQERISNTSILAKNVSRTLPKVRIHGGLNLDRPIKYFGNNLSQTLEPQIQYLYIPNKNQSNIGIYDTTALQDDYNGLFRERRFSGLDRIAQANQFSWGLTSRVLTSSNQEILRVSIGKILYLNNSNTAFNDTQTIKTNQSVLAGDVFYQMSKKLELSGNIQYDTRQGFTTKSATKFDYQYAQNHLLQLSHRYTRNVSGNKIEQISLLTSGAINKDWQFVGRLTQDLVNKRNIESYAGIQYESCCWAIRLAYHRNINSKINDQLLLNKTHNEFDSGFVVQFVIKGLGGQQSSVGIEDMFNSSIFGYKKPYFLNN